MGEFHYLEDQGGPLFGYPVDAGDGQLGKRHGFGKNLFALGSPLLGDGLGQGGSRNKELLTCRGFYRPRIKEEKVALLLLPIRDLFVETTNFAHDWPYLPKTLFKTPPGAAFIVSIVEAAGEAAGLAGSALGSAEAEAGAF